jgi:hypothetical protein
MRTELVEMTPALAKEFLKLNTINRPVRPSHVETLFQAFSRGEYVTTHQGIAFDSEGRLIDGQHRLLAIASMPDGFSVQILVTWGLARDAAFQVIDSTQAKRSTSDVLKIDRSVGETANFLARLYSGTFTGITPAFVKPFADFVQPEIGDLTTYCPTSVRTWSSAPVRAAAAIKMKIGDADHVKLVYAALVRRDFDAMPKSAQSLFRAFMTGTVRAAASNDIFARCLKVFEPANAGLSKIQINDVGAMVEEVRTYLDDSIFKPMRVAAAAKAPATARPSTGKSADRAAAAVR